MDKVVNVPLDAEARLEVAAMVYARWSDAYDAMKAAKAATWDGKSCPKGDWPLFHAAQLKHAQEALAKAERLKDQICKFSPILEPDYWKGA